MRKSPVFIGVGSNLGNRKANIEKAIDLVKRIKGIKFRRVSSIYETEPEGRVPQGKYLNGVFEISTALKPPALLTELKSIEKGLGRKRSVKSGPRTIDLDILLFGKRKMKTPSLTIPHPRMHKREFVLKGLRELKNCRSGPQVTDGNLL